MRVAILLWMATAVLGGFPGEGPTPELMTCDTEGPGYFKFFSKTMDQLAPGESLTFRGHCFKEISVRVTQEEGKIKAEIDARGLKELGCLELLLVSTGKTTNVQVMPMPTRYVQEVPLAQLTAVEQEYVQTTGLFILRGCDDLRNFPRDLWMTIKLFIGGWFTSQWIPIFGSKIPEFQVRANMDFVKRATGYEWKIREDRKKVLLNQKYIRSGDFLGLTRFDGVANVAHVVAGSPVGHCAMALWDAGTLYVIETEDGGGNTRKGIKRTEYNEWLRHADHGDNNLVVVRLKKELRDKLNVPAMWAAFKLIEGIPYGFNNFIFGSQDTVDQNRPDYFDPNFVVVFAGMLFKWFPSVVNRVLVNGLNMRLGTRGLDVDGIWQEIYQQKVTVPDLLAIVEDEDWEYPEGISLVCSSLLVYLYKAGGLFDDLTINSPEFTPSDVLALDFWDLKDQELIEACKGRAPRGYCQVMGMFDMDLGRIGYVTPYSNMNERCPSMPPHYYRPDDC